ncbi:MAG: DDE-type integrase/transposase/recombinase [Casimicrobiaceae bacterium]
MNDRHDAQDRDRWARLRFSIIGPLLAAPPVAGALGEALRALSATMWRDPCTDLPITFATSTIERWYYAARAADQDPVVALETRVRCDAGLQRSLAPTLIEALATQYQAHPSWSAQLHYDNLRAAVAGELPMPSYSTLRRYLKAHGLFKRGRVRRDPTAGMLAAVDHLQAREVRSFELEHVNALWHLDFHHGSRKVLTRQGVWVTPMALAVLDDRSRLACHVQWYLDETTESLVHGFSQALQRRGLPRALMTDNGAAMLAEEFTAGLHQLGIVHQTTLPYSPYQNAKQESFWGRVEGRLMAMLEGVDEISLDLLNRATCAWVEQEYQRSLHSELGSSPLARYLAGPEVGRECPGSDALRAAFRRELTRHQRRSDGTLSLDGQRFEIPSRYRHLERVQVRYAHWDLRRVDLLDARRGTVLCALYPLDKSANADGARRALEAVSPTPLAPPASGLAPLLRQLMADYAATGLPPAYLPTEPNPESHP